MLTRPNIGLAIEQDELKGFSRTIAEIEWLLLILVLIYLVAGAPATRAASRSPWRCASSARSSSACITCTSTGRNRGPS